MSDDIIVVAILFLAVVGLSYCAVQFDRWAFLKQGEWYCSDARVDSLDLPLSVKCYEYKRKEAGNERSK